MPSKLTDRLCERTRPNPARDVYLRDDVVSGFALRILPSGAKTFELRCRINGRLRRMSLGAYVPDVGSLARARRAAVELRAKIIGGENPADERIERRKVDAIKATSFKTLCDRWIDSAQTGRGRGGKLEGRIRKSWQADREQLDRHFGDWAAMPLGSITTTDVAKRLNLIARRSPVAANRCASLLSTIFRAAVRWGLMTTNPASRSSAVSRAASRALPG